MEVKIKFSKLLRNLRIQRQLTLKEVATKSGLSERYISYLERGTYQPSLEKVIKIAHALNIDPSEIVGLISKPDAD